MSALEIVLLIIGLTIFVLSFIVPVTREEASKETKELAKSEIENMVSKEMNAVKEHVDDVVNESIEYAIEKTERSLERLTNEKIMAVSDYSDTVLQEIHKNHEEVMFLYDMLNEKHTNLKNTVSQVNKTAKEAEAVVSSFQMLKPETVQTEEAKILEEPIIEADNKGNVKAKAASAKRSGRAKRETIPAPVDEVKDADGSTEMEISFTSDEEESGANSNARILELHKQGKSKVAIAKELGLGVGEVKLVIDLYKNM